MYSGKKSNSANTQMWLDFMRIILK